MSNDANCDGVLDGSMWAVRDEESYSVALALDVFLERFVRGWN